MSDCILLLLCSLQLFMDYGLTYDRSACERRGGRELGGRRAPPVHPPAASDGLAAAAATACALRRACLRPGRQQVALQGATGTGWARTKPWRGLDSARHYRPGRRPIQECEVLTKHPHAQCPADSAEDAQGQQQGAEQQRQQQR